MRQVHAAGLRPYDVPYVLDLWMSSLGLLGKQPTIQLPGFDEALEIRDVLAVVADAVGAVKAHLRVELHSVQTLGAPYLLRRSVDVLRNTGQVAVPAGEVHLVAVTAAFLKQLEALPDALLTMQLEQPDPLPLAPVIESVVTTLEGNTEITLPVPSVPGLPEFPPVVDILRMIQERADELPKIFVPTLPEVPVKSVLSGVLNSLSGLSLPIYQVCVLCCLCRSCAHAHACEKCLWLTRSG